MTSDEPLTIDYLKKLCAAGLEWVKRYGSANTAYVEQMILPELGTAVRGIRSRIEERHRIPTVAENVTLWVTHYTSLSAVTSMLRELADGQESVLRLYDTSHCNDPDEGNHLVRELSSNNQHRWLEQGSGVGHAYMTSFVSDEDEQDMSDDLVFWRTYGKDGKGCSLTVDVPSRLLREVLYEPADVDVIRKPLLPVLGAVTPLAQADEQCAKAISETIWKHLADVRYLYKDLAYHHEREYRVVRVGTEPDIRSGGARFEPHEESGSLVEVRHYCELPDLDLRKLLASNSNVILGPSVRDRYSVRLYFEALKRQARADDPGLHDFPIQESQIRYHGD